MRITLLTALALATVPAAGFGQGGGAVASIVPLWERAKDLYLKSAEQIPEDKLGFRPTEKVRTFGQILGHIANDHYVFCSAVLDEKDPNTQDFEKTTTRSGLIQALKDSFVYCDRAYRISDAKSFEQVDIFGNKGSRLWALNFNVIHDGEHYGNLVTYFRLNGLVPPSSQGQ